MTCPPPLGYPSTSLGECTPPEPDYSLYCATLDPPVKPLPVWWRNACVSYDIQKDASRQVPYATASKMFASAFAKWTGTACPTGGDGGSRLSIDVRDLGPVDCDLVQYSSDQGNQHVIIFHDDCWGVIENGKCNEHNDANNTLGLTTITFNPDTGELYDADMEINSTPKIPLSISDSVPGGGYDFQSIITHESGHFLGMAHATDTRSTMYARYIPGTSNMRSLTPDDVAGICTIYPPSGKRSVDRSVATNGIVAADACDPTPRHGFQSQCAQPQEPNTACAITSHLGGGPSRVPSLPAVGFAAIAAAAVRRKRRRVARGASSL
jgi:hypothetical protein